MNLPMQSEDEAFERTKVKLWIALNLSCVVVVLLMVGGGIQSRKCQAAVLHSLLLGGYLGISMFAPRTSAIHPICYLRSQAQGVLEVLNCKNSQEMVREAQNKVMWEQKGEVKA